MDYEKDYKEALERARKLYNDCVKGDNPVQAQRYVDIFPELNEQPDPRHSLIEFIKWSCDRGSITPEQRKNVDFWLAYFEKQKKQQPAKQLGGTFTSDDMAKTFTEGQNYVIAHPEKFGLCKPAEWSEEDLQHKSWILECLADGKRTMPEYAADFHAAYNWLKSLRPQPKAKLTLLDENIITAAIAFVEQNEHFNCWCGIDKHTVIKALRSLKPHWKPSEEQMEAVEEALEFYSGTTDTAKGLRSLYNDLKKLEHEITL